MTVVVLSTVLAFALGAIVGSFINVLVVRRGTGFGMFRSSFCFSCGRKLEWHELIPIVSFFVQRGRCRQCQSKISLRYPFVEFATALVFSFIMYFNFSAVLSDIFWVSYWLIIASTLMAIAVYDVRHSIIPDSFVYVFDVLALVAVVWLFWDDFISIASHAAAGITFFTLFAFLWSVSSGRWMGLGDAKLVLGIGVLLGFSSGIAALVLAFWSGAIVGISLLVISRFSSLLRQGKRVTIKNEIPFAPFLVFGTFLSFIFEISFLDLQALFIFS